MDDFATLPSKLLLNGILVSRFAYLISFHFISYPSRHDPQADLTYYRGVAGAFAPESLLIVFSLLKHPLCDTIGIAYPGDP